MHTETDRHAALALLEWYTELGVTDAVTDAPIDRFAQAAADAPVMLSHAPVPEPAQPLATMRADMRAPAGLPLSDAGPDPAVLAHHAASAATDLEALRAALMGFEQCELKKGARTLVFCDGRPGARVMIIGEAPGRDEDRLGRPFVGRAGQLLDRMFAAIGMERAHPDPAHALYITNMLPWRPPQNRDPSPAELAMMLPFVARHVELAGPDVLVLMGRIAAQTLLETSDGITRLRGRWHEVLGRPALPMLHPAYLLRTPAAKREAWADLLSLQAKLRTPS